MAVSIGTKVPLDVLLTFQLNTGDTLTVQASQATSRGEIDRSMATMPKQSFGGDDEEAIGKLEVFPPIVRQMLDAYYAKMEADILDNEENQIFTRGMTLSQYRDVWGLTFFDQKIYTVVGAENLGKVSLRDMMLEAVYRANPTWDFRTDPETGEPARVLRSYNSEDKK